jgi:5-hydroxyisourate hydrolase
MSQITTHVLDLALGKPAAGIAVLLELRVSEGQWQTLGRGNTDADGRLRSLLPANHELAAGVYRLVFDLAPYYRTAGVECFYPTVPIVFAVRDISERFHVPLLLSPFGYSTYRGS